MLHNPYKIVKMFEEEMAAFCGAPYAVSVDSCTNALFLIMSYLKEKNGNAEPVTIPTKTYLSVPQSMIHAGYDVVFDDRAETNNWNGIYQLKPYPVFDAAKRLKRNMYIQDSFMCLSFHAKKHLKIGKGGMVLTSDFDAVDWIKKARYEGRSEVFYTQDNIKNLGWNYYMTPEEAARGLVLMQNFPDDASDIDEGKNGYRNLTEFDLFKNHKIIRDEN